MLEDDDLMPWGKYKGKKMQDVPADYLLYMYENNKCGSDVKEYIEDCIDILKKEVKESKELKNKH